MGEVRREPAMAADHPLQRRDLVGREVVLGAAPRARQVDVARILGPVVLGATLEVGVPDHAHPFEHGQGAVHGRGVHGREPSLDPPGHVLRGDVSVGAQDLAEDGLALRRDPVPALPEHGHDGANPIHGPRLLHGSCGEAVRPGVTLDSRTCV